MATKTIRTLKDTSNAAVLNTIRENASLEYQRRIPEATKANQKRLAKAILEYGPARNEFVSALVNQIGLIYAHNISWTNVLAPFKRGKLEMGDTIEEIQVGLLQAHEYETDREHLERDIWGQELPDIQSNFHKINRTNWYKVSINDALLKRAFLEPSGLSNFAQQLMAAPETSDEWDEFLLTCNQFAEYEASGGFFKVNVPDVADLESSPEMARAALRKMRAMADTLGFPSTRYNAAKMPTFAREEDLVIFCSPEFKAAVDVEALAAAFNIESAIAKGRIIVLPQDKFGIDGAQAIMTTKDFFIIADTLLETRSTPNPVGLYENHFLHHWQIISSSRFVPAVLFTTGPGDELVTVQSDVTGISAIVTYNDEAELVTDVARGSLYSLEAEAITNPAGGDNDAVRWDVSGHTSSGTYITQNGVLHVGALEGSNSITVTATATYLDPSDLMKDGESAFVNLNVVGAALRWANTQNGPTVTGITVKGVPVAGFAPNVYTYNAVPTAGGTVTAKDIKAVGPEAGDVKILVSNNGTTATVYSPSSPGDPTYAVNVVAAP
jgi:hypothetical protein